MTDPLINLSLHESTIQLIVSLLRTLADLAEPEAHRLPTELGGYLAQALDTTADLDLLFSTLAESLEQARRNASRT